MAAAFALPSIVLFSTSNPAIWAPWRTEAEIIVAPDGMNQVSVSRVVAALERLHVLKDAHRPLGPARGAGSGPDWARIRDEEARA